MAEQRVTVLIPALNEADSLPMVLGQLPSFVSVVVIDNGSTDNTADVAKQNGAVVVSESQRGYGSAILAGIRSIEVDPPDIVVILDADHADRADLIGYLTEPIRAGLADFVLSDRTMHAEAGALTRTQLWGNAFACALMRVSTGHLYRDMGPFRAIRWSALQALQMQDLTWGWNVEMQMKAIQHGLRVREVPLPYRCRYAGASKISGSFKGAVRAGMKIIWAVGYYHNG